MMEYLLDTNFLSETANPRPDPGVVAWTQSQSALVMSVSALSFGAIRKGIDLLAWSRKRERLERWLTIDLPEQFFGRVLPVDEEVALTWGRITAEARQKGRHVPVVDGLLVSTALVHGLTLVTRNERDCAGWGAPILNPWSS